MTSAFASVCFCDVRVVCFVGFHNESNCLKDYSLLTNTPISSFALSFGSFSSKLAIQYILRFFWNMALNLDELTVQAQRLPKDQRFTLAYRILKDADSSGDSTDSDAWETVIDQRITDFKAGKIKSIPANEVFARIDQHLEK